MGVFEFMAPQWAAAEHMRELASSMRTRSLRRSSTHSMRIKACEEDIGFLALIMFALVRKLMDNGALAHRTSTYNGVGMVVLAGVGSRPRLRDTPGDRASRVIPVLSV